MNTGFWTRLFCSVFCQLTCLLAFTGLAGPPAIVSPAILANGTFKFQLSGTPGQTYTIQASTDLVGWLNICVTNAATNLVNVLDPNAPQVGLRYYRAVLGGPPPAVVLAAATQLITAANGGTITLSNGSYVSIPPAFLTNDAIATVSLLSAFPNLPSVGSLTNVGPVLSLSLFPTNLSADSSRRSGGPQPLVAQNLEFSINYSYSTASGFNGSAPVIQSLVPQLVDFPLEGIFSGISGSLGSSDQTATVSISQSDFQNYTVNQSQTSLNVAWANTYPFPPLPLTLPQKLLWVNGSWSTDLSAFNPSLKTIVFVHGMNSCVEWAFGDITPIMTAGCYDQAIGFDYDWTTNLETSGNLLASFLNGLHFSTGFDIEAHSEGCPVALWAVSQIPSTQKIPNLILLGGAILGTPAAATANSHLPSFSIILLLPYIKPGGCTPFGLQMIENGPFASDMIPGSTVLTQILSAFATSHPETSVIEAAGSAPLFYFEPVDYIFGKGVSNDGIIPVTSALFNNLYHPVSIALFPLSHPELTTNAAVIQYVANALTTEASTNLLGTWKGVWSGYSQPSAADDYTDWSTPVNGTWTLVLTQYDPVAQTASGSLTWQGTDAYWIYTVNHDSNGGQYLTDVASYPYPVALTITFVDGLTADGSGAGGWQTGCGIFRFGLENNAGGTVPPYGLYFAVNLTAAGEVVGSTGGWDTSWDAQVFYPDWQNAIGDGESGGGELQNLSGSKQPP